MALPVVAILGRIWAGAICPTRWGSEMISVVEPTTGVTRDRVSTHPAKEVSQLIPSNGKTLHESAETGQASSNI